MIVPLLIYKLEKKKNEKSFCSLGCTINYKKKTVEGWELGPLLVTNYYSNKPKNRPWLRAYDFFFFNFFLMSFKLHLFLLNLFYFFLASFTLLFFLLSFVYFFKLILFLLNFIKFYFQVLSFLFNFSFFYHFKFLLLLLNLSLFILHHTYFISWWNVLNKY